MCYGGSVSGNLVRRFRRAGTFERSPDPRGEGKRKDPTPLYFAVFDPVVPASSPAFESDETATW